MPTQIFVNLPVRDPDASAEFFRRLGYTFHPEFTDESGLCVIVDDAIHVMLLTEERFRSFAPNPVCDARQRTEVLISLTCESREKVDEMVRAAVAAGGSTYGEAKDFGYMYVHGFQDPDGHAWELVWMSPRP